MPRKRDEWCRSGDWRPGRGFARGWCSGPESVNLRADFLNLQSLRHFSLAPQPSGTLEDLAILRGVILVDQLLDAGDPFVCFVSLSGHARLYCEAALSADTRHSATRAGG